jgi:hypothetical protein
VPAVKLARGVVAAPELQRDVRTLHAREPACGLQQLRPAPCRDTRKHEELVDLGRQPEVFELKTYTASR